MPAKSRWLTKIPEIIERLSASKMPVLDRIACQRVFGVKKRRAVELMKLFGGYESANVMLLDRLGMIEQLKKISDGDELAEERQRKEHLAARLEKVSRFRSAAAVRIVVSPEAIDRTFPDLPAGVCLANGKLTVEFSDAAELLQHLYELACAAANNFESFRETVEAEARIPENPAAEKST